MTKLCAALAALAAVFFAAPAFAENASLTDRHVLFDNALSPDGYFASSSYVVAPSSLTTFQNQFPVSSDHFVSPPNALKLSWRSSIGGDWGLTVRIDDRFARDFPFDGDAVTFWVYPDFEITPANTPRISFADRNGAGAGGRALVRGEARIPANRWTLVTLRADELAVGLSQSTDVEKFDLSKLRSITFVQGLPDDAPRTIYIDDIQVRPAASTDRTAPPAPARTEARGQERHFDVTWTASTGADLLSYRIYRSTDGRRFTPIGTQAGHLTRYVDFFGEPGQRAFYRVTAIDIAGNESRPSRASAAAQTHAMSDDELMTMVQEANFRYYWEAAHPIAGLAPEILPGDPNLLALGGSGFGVMALIVGAERGFQPREAVAERILRIARFLDSADRFHGVWPHFLNGDTGKAIPLFGPFDNGGDLVETAFMMQGLLAARQYFNRDTATEREIRDTVTKMWREIEWDWYRKTPDSDVLYWHWSPDHAFHISHPLIGWNETMIIYLLAIASPTHAVPASMYHTGWAGTSPLHVAYRQNWSRSTLGDHYVNGGTYYGHKLDVGVDNGADLFFIHFSYMGFDPRAIRDRYTNYFRNNRNIALINHDYAVENPRGYKGYGPDNWGISVGVNAGGGRPRPNNDNGTISVMASLSSMPYTPEESMAALRHFYRDHGRKVFGVYGFHDGFNETQNWFAENYMALNQAPSVVMIENHRTGLIWRNFMANPEIAPALDAIGFVKDE